jgi:HK97 family phage portal protein
MDGLDAGAQDSRSKAGTRVSPKSAMTCSAVYACVRVISESVGALPVHLYRRTEEGKQVAAESRLDFLLHAEPNPRMDSAVFRETMMGHLLLWGNAYAEIEFDRAGEIVALWPVPPWRAERREAPSGEAFYSVQLPDGRSRLLPAAQVFHLMGHTDDGLTGKSVLSAMRESVGLGLAVEEFGANYFSKGTNLGGFMEVPGKLSDQAFERLKKGIDEGYRGLSRSHRVIILEEGAKFAKTVIPPNDSQMLETRRFQTEEIARFFRVPPHLIQSLERSTNNNIEHQGIDFVTHCIRPWVVKWEMAVQRQLLFGAEKAGMFARFNLAGLLRGDAKSRYESYAIGRQWGWLSANDIRELEDMDRLPGEQGDMYLVPMNMIPADRVGDVLSLEADAAAGPGERPPGRRALAFRLKKNLRSAPRPQAGS